MIRISDVPARRVLVSLALVLLLALPIAANDSALRQQILELSKVTGTDAINGQYKALVDDPKGTKKLLAEAVTMAKEKKEQVGYNAAYILAQAAADLKDIKTSEALFRLCMKDAAKLQSTFKLLQSYGGLIDLFQENKMYAESARVCRELLELKTDDGKPRIVLFAVSTPTGETDFVESDTFDTARRLRPAVHRLLIEAVTKQGKYDQALKLVDNLVKASDNWRQRQLRGWVLEEAGKIEEAVKVYEECLQQIAKDKELEKEEKELYTERFRRMLSSLYVDLKQIDKATEILEQLKAKHPDEPGFYNDLGYIWADNDLKLEEAEKLIRQALDLDRKKREANPKLSAKQKQQENGAYLDSLGWVLFKQKKLNEAKEWLLKAIEDKAAQHIEIYDHLGDVHMALGEREAALAAWRKGLESVSESRRDKQRKADVERKLEKYGKSASGTP
jgi:tetratricopeptide (TPR) repeat protein